MPPPDPDTLPLRDVEIRVGGHRLHALAADPPAGVGTTARVAVLSGYGDHAGRYAHVLRWLATGGVAAAALSFRGHGRSTGRVAHCRRWDDYLADAAAFLNALPPSPGTPGEGRGEGGLERPTDLDIPTHPHPNPLPGYRERGPGESPPLFVLGHSHGGLVAAAMAERGLLPGVRGVILSAPFFELALPVPRGRRLLAAVLARTLPGMPLRSTVTADLLTGDPAMAAADPLCPGVATPGWFAAATAARRAVAAAAGSFAAPLLMLVPGDDRLVAAAAAVAFFGRCGSTDKTVHHYPGARHELLRDLGRAAVLEAMSGWIAARSRRGAESSRGAGPAPEEVLERLLPPHSGCPEGTLFDPAKGVPSGQPLGGR